MHIPTNFPVFDSFTTSTAVEFFDSIPKQLTDQWQLINVETGEGADTQNVPLFIDSFGVRFRVSIVNWFGKSFIRITFTSKFLFSNYFQGLNYGNFRQAFVHMCKQTTLCINYDTFLDNSTVNDIDICSNIYLTDFEFLNTYKKFSHYAGIKKFNSKRSNALDNSKIIGFQFTNRKDASITTPFVKAYSKYFEMHDLKNEKFLPNIIGANLHDLRRIEITIKNKAHLQSVCNAVKIEVPNTLRKLLLLNVHDVKLLFDCVANRYVPNDSVNVKDIGCVEVPYTPAQALQVAMLWELMQNGYTFQQVVNLFDNFPFFSLTAKSRLKQRLAESLKIYSKSQDLNNLRITPKDAFCISKEESNLFFSNNG